MKPLEKYFASLRVLLQLVPFPALEEIVETLETARRSNARVFVIGSHGNANTVTHVAHDLVETTSAGNAPGFRVVALVDRDSPLEPGTGDRNVEPSLADRLGALIGPDDVVIAIAGRGETLTMVDAVDVASEAGATPIAMTGFAGGQLIDLAALTLVVPTARREQIEDVHLAMMHAICRMLHERAGMLV